METREEQVRPELLALFENAGLEITLRTLISWASGKMPSPSWYEALVLDALRFAQRIYEGRAFYH